VRFLSRHHGETGRIKQRPFSSSLSIHGKARLFVASRHCECKANMLTVRDNVPEPSLSA